mmetsp:Transcript_22079/g.47602  ORF Transcript_22079/g.47602 Transcript_22079/m.47602 type:complete len:150 (-) Transcript_22079:286-735(-)
MLAIHNIEGDHLLADRAAHAPRSQDDAAGHGRCHRGRRELSGRCCHESESCSRRLQACHPACGKGYAGKSLVVPQSNTGVIRLRGSQLEAACLSANSVSAMYECRTPLRHARRMDGSLQMGSAAVVMLYPSRPVACTTWRVECAKGPHW